MVQQSARWRGEMRRAARRGACTHGSAREHVERDEPPEGVGEAKRRRLAGKATAARAQRLRLVCERHALERGGEGGEPAALRPAHLLQQAVQRAARHLRPAALLRTRDAYVRAAGRAGRVLARRALVELEHGREWRAS